MPLKKELHFFDNETGVDWLHPDYSIYHRFFQMSKSSQILGEATPIYTFWPPSMARIQRYNSDMLLIVSLRHPIDRAYSHWKMDVTRGIENLDFSCVIREGRKRGRGFEKSLSKHDKMFKYVERGLFAPQIRRIFCHFPSEQTLFVTVDQLAADSNGLLDRICRFLGIVDYSTYPELQYVQPVEPRDDLPDISINDRAYLGNIFFDDIAETAKLTRLDLSAWT